MILQLAVVIGGVMCTVSANDGHSGDGEKVIPSLPSSSKSSEGCFFNSIYLLPNSKARMKCLFESIRNDTKFHPTSDVKVGKLVVSCASRNRPSMISAQTLKDFSALEEFSLLDCAISELPDGLFSRQQNLKRLEIRTANHMHIPAGLFRSLSVLQKLTIRSGNGLTADPGVLCSLTQLQHLDLTNNSIETIHGLVTGIKPDRPCLQSLTTLDMSLNNVTSVDFELAESCCPSLHSLDLSRNGVSYVTPKAFQGLTHLYKLNLSSNNLTQLSLENFTVEHLSLENNNLLDISLRVDVHKLSAGHNKLPAESVSHINMASLQELDLKSNDLDITELPTDVFTTTSALAVLHLGGNICPFLPGKLFQNLQNLTILSLCDCGLKRMDQDALDGLSSLEILDLSYNKLQQTDVFNNTPRLKQLILIANEFHVIPSDLKVLHYLELLDLGHNHISHIAPGAFSELRSLQILGLNHNDIRVLVSGAFYNLSSLIALNLMNNSITQIEDGSFEGLERLLSIYLEYNDIDNISHCFIVDNMKLLGRIGLHGNRIRVVKNSAFPISVRRIDLARNNITRIEPFAFTDLKSLEYIDLTHNQLHFIPEAAFFARSHYHGYRASFYLAGNPLACQCSMTYLKYLNNENHDDRGFVDDLDSLSCKLLDGTTRFIANVTEEEFLCEQDVACEPNCDCCSLPRNQSCACRQRCPANCTCIINESQTLNIVNCSGESYQNVPHKIPHSVTRLDFSRNHLSYLDAGIFSSLVNTTAMLLNQNWITAIYPGTFRHSRQLEALDLSHNMLRWLNVSVFSGLKSLQYLNLSVNLLDFIDYGTFHTLPMLRSLDVSCNRLEQINLVNVLGNVTPTAIWLTSNPWECSCNTTSLKDELIAWTEAIRNISSLMCADVDPRLVPANMTPATSLSVIQADFSRCKESSVQIEFQRDMRAGLIFGVVVVLLAVIAVSLTVRFRDTLQLWTYAYCGARCWGRNSDKEYKRYDAFVAFSDDDTQFVVNELIPRLERTEDPHKLCIRLRDWLVGESIADITVESIENSHRTILLLSDHFLHNEWADFEFQAAHHRQIQTKSKHLIVFLLQDEPPENLDRGLQMYLSSNQCIKLSDPWCWEKLAMAMPKLTAQMRETRRNEEPTAIERATEVQRREMARQNLRFENGTVVVGDRSRDDLAGDEIECDERMELNQLI